MLTSLDPNSGGRRRVTGNGFKKKNKIEWSGNFFLREISELFCLIKYSRKLSEEHYWNIYSHEAKFDSS